MRKICFVRTDMNISSGASNATINVANALSEFYSVSVISIYGSPEKPNRLSDDISFFTLNPGKSRLRENFISGARRLHSHLKEHQVDVVFSVSLSPAPVVLAAASRTSAKPVLIEHSNRRNTIDSDQKHELLYKLAIPHFNHIVTLTEADKMMYLEMYGLESNSVSAIPNWIGQNVLDKASSCDLNAKKILSVGRVCPVKGYDLLVQTAIHLHTAYPDWSWDIFGPGEDGYDEHIQGLIDEHQLNSFLTLKGGCDKIIELYHQYSIFVLTSYYEGIPLVLLEAQANSMPTVAFDCPTGPSEIIDDGINGYLIPCYNTEKMAAQLSMLMSQRSLRESFSRHAQDNIEHFSEKQVLSQWMGLIELL